MRPKASTADQAGVEAEWRVADARLADETRSAAGDGTVATAGNTNAAVEFAIVGGNGSHR